MIVSRVIQIILHNVQRMTRVLKTLENDGRILNEDVLSGLASYRRQHINRFGEYSLDLDRDINSLNYKIKIETIIQ